MRSRSSTGAVRWLSPRQTRRCTSPRLYFGPGIENAEHACARDRRRRDLHGCRARRGRAHPHREGADRRAAAGRRSSAPPPRSAPRDVDRFTHGTTIATNALLERRGARTALVTNEGFEHVLHLRRQTRAHLYRPCVEHSPPLVPLERCVGVRGTHGPGRRARPARPRHAPADRRRGDRRLAPVLVPRRGARAARRRGAPPPLPVRARRRVARGRAGVPRVRARLDDRGRRVPRARALALPAARSGEPVPTRGSRSRS